MKRRKAGRMDGGREGVNSLANALYTSIAMASQWPEAAGSGKYYNKAPPYSFGYLNDGWSFKLEKLHFSSFPSRCFSNHCQINQ